MTQDSHTFEIKYVTGTKVYLDESGETVITIAYVEIPDSHQPRIIGCFAASSSVAEAYCRQLMEVLGIQEKEWPDERDVRKKDKKPRLNTLRCGHIAEIGIEQFQSGPIVQPPQSLHQ